MTTLRTEADARTHARRRQADARYGVGAAVWADRTESDEPRAKLLVLVTDGVEYLEVEAQVPRAELLNEALISRVEHVIENRVGPRDRYRKVLHGVAHKSPFVLPEVVLGDVEEDCSA